MVDHLSQIVMIHLRRLSLTAAFIIGGIVGILLLCGWNTWIVSNRAFINEGDYSLIYYKQKLATKHDMNIPSRLHFKYLNEYAANIDGWFSHEILYVLWTINQFQYEHLHIIGGIGEIGVHHGKLTCYLYLLRRYREQTLFAVDVFENQALNKDGSGRGQKDLFLTNIQKYAQVYRNEIAIYAGSSLDLNPSFSANDQSISWWRVTIVADRRLQLVSVDGGHTALLTYSDLCLVSNAMVDGGVVTVDDINHPGWLGVQDGVGRFLAETSTLLIDVKLENEMAKIPNRTTFKLSRRIVAATNVKSKNERKSKCSRLVPFLQYYNKLFLTTPNYYPYYIELLGKPDHFANEARESGIYYLEYHALRLTIGNVPVWTDNHELNTTYKANIFKQFIEPNWFRELKLLDNRMPNTG